MRGFPFGASSSSEGLAYSKTMGLCAEREAPYANSLPEPGGRTMDVWTVGIRESENSLSSPGGDHPGVETEDVHAADVTRMLDLQAAVHDHVEPGFGRD